MLKTYGSYGNQWHVHGNPWHISPKDVGSLVMPQAWPWAPCPTDAARIPRMPRAATAVPTICRRRHRGVPVLIVLGHDRRTKKRKSPRKITFFSCSKHSKPGNFLRLNGDFPDFWWPWLGDCVTFVFAPTESPTHWDWPLHRRPVHLETAKFKGLLMFEPKKQNWVTLW